MSWLRRLGTLRGIVGALFLLAKPIWGLLNFLSTVDFIAQHVPSVKKVMEGHLGTWGPVLIGVVLIVWALSDKYDAIRFFENHDALPGIRRELRQMHSADVVWPAGGSGNQVDEDGLRNIRRLILGDPRLSDAELSTRVERFGATTVDEVRTAIRALTRRAQAHGVDVRWHRDPSMSLILNNPEHWWHHRWGRLEIILPETSSYRRPSILVTNRHRGLLNALDGMYEKLWANAQQAEQLGPSSIAHMTARQS